MDKVDLSTTKTRQHNETYYQPIPQEERLLPEELYESFKSIAKAIVQTFGAQCEVVLHDFADIEHSIVWIEGNVTGRRVGGSLTDLGMEMVLAGDTRDLFNYQTTAPDGSMLKSSSIFIRNESGQAIGAFCINVDMTALKMAEQVLRSLTLTTNEEMVEETFYDRTSEILDRVVDKCAVELGTPLELMDKADRIALMELLDQKGIFQLRRSVPLLAERLGVTRQTIYNYLNEAEIDSTNSN